MVRMYWSARFCIGVVIIFQIEIYKASALIQKYSGLFVFESITINTSQMVALIIN